MKNVGNSNRGRSQGVPKIFRAIAQLSCFIIAVNKRAAHGFVVNLTILIVEL